MRKRYCPLLLIGILLCGASLGVYAQQTDEAKPELVFADHLHNFGIIAEEKGPVTCTFRFANKGNAPLVLTHVSTDCGCTTPTYTREVVPPDGEGSLQVSYDPAKRPGPFVKQIRVYSNADTIPVLLRIKGSVANRGGYEGDVYQHKIGGLSVSSARLEFPIATSARPSTVRLILRNDAKRVTEVSLSRLPGMINADKISFSLAPDEVEEIALTTHISASERPGLKYFPLELSVMEGGQAPLSGHIKLFVPVVELFEEEAKAPRLELRTYHDLGLASPAETLSGRITFRNTGEIPLILYSLTPSSDALFVQLEQDMLVPGKSANISYKLDLQGISTNQKEISATVTVVCNDPQAPLRKIKLIAHLKDE